MRRPVHGRPATYTSGAQSGKTPLSPCPAVLSISPTVAGATYAIDLTLLQGVQPLAGTTCTAQASGTEAVLATCAPVGLVIDAGSPVLDAASPVVDGGSPLGDP